MIRLLLAAVALLAAFTGRTPFDLLQLHVSPEPTYEVAVTLGVVLALVLVAD